MIELTQYKLNSTDLCGAFTKLGEISVTMNKDIIKKDIDRLKAEMAATKNKYNKLNLEALVTYLTKLHKNIDSESNFELCWNISKKDDLPYTYPVQLVNEPLYKINTSNYMEVGEKEKVVEIDLTDLADIIAFEFMYRDLNETHDTIEELLKDCGIIGYQKSNLLTDFFKENGDHMYELSKTMLIEDSPYKSHETHMIKDYFYSKEFKSKSYRDVVDYSCRYASTIIANSILKNSTHHGIDVKLIMTNATTITFIANIDDEFNIYESLLGEISVRVFGRRFMIEPKISVF